VYRAVLFKRNRWKSRRRRREALVGVVLFCFVFVGWLKNWRE
jgi:hypothetical protein